ncbi:MAG TPA: hypothetical protein ENM99_03565, partial [Desulfurella acetivorans]|nr:hypothetical protein [Desulfurella acetivorans]
MLEILFIGLVFVLTKIFGEGLKPFGIPQLITYVTLGIVLGPCVFNLIKPNEIFYIFAEIGILFLLYESGLEINLKSGLKTNLNGVLVATIGAFVPFFIALIIAKFLGYNED